MIDENRSTARANFAIFGNSDIIRKGKDQRPQ
jgi:hypothetical protein